MWARMRACLLCECGGNNSRQQQMAEPLDHIKPHNCSSTDIHLKANWHLKHKWISCSWISFIMGLYNPGNLYFIQHARIFDESDVKHIAFWGHTCWFLSYHAFSLSREPTTLEQRFCVISAPDVRFISLLLWPLWHRPSIRQRWLLSCSDQEQKYLQSKKGLNFITHQSIVLQECYGGSVPPFFIPQASFWSCQVTLLCFLFVIFTFDWWRTELNITQILNRSKFRHHKRLLFCPSPSPPPLSFLQCWWRRNTDKWLAFGQSHRRGWTPFQCGRWKVLPSEGQRAPDDAGGCMCTAESSRKRWCCLRTRWWRDS